VAQPDAAFRARISAIDTGIVVSRVRTMQGILNRSVWRERFFATLLACFGGLALVLAAIGLYGVIAYTVGPRTHEMRIQIAMGASSSNILGMILGQSGYLIGAGVVAGLFGSLAATRYLKTQLYGISPTDLPTLVGAAVVLVGAGLIASYLPARRATRVDP